MARATGLVLVGANIEMTEIRDPRLLWLKFGLFLLVGVLAFGLAILLLPSFKLAGLMAIAIWAFCRAYYFAFYVIERYIDPSYRFAGLSSLLVYVLRRRRGLCDKSDEA
jgi:hypothetical protein